LAVTYSEVSTMTLKVAAVTMVFNEAHLLPRWIRHYAPQFGPENCTVIDHGSDDGCTDAMGRVNLVRIPRSPTDEFISGFCASLLTWYDWVIYTDVDEFLVADPAYYASIRELLVASPHKVITAVGFNVHHNDPREPPIDPERPVSEQRRWMMMVVAMCKPLAISRPVQWAAGFHSSDAEVAFDRLFLFHLRNYDTQQSLLRLHKTRTMPRLVHDADPNAIIDDDEWRTRMRRIMDQIRKAGLSFDIGKPPLAGLLDTLKKESEQRKDELYKLRLHLAVPELWELPPRFVGTF
jgi:hypothetical protein